MRNRFKEKRMETYIDTDITFENNSILNLI